MKIVVVDFAASVGGAISILKSFYQHLIEKKDKNEWVFLLSDYYIMETDNIKVILMKKEKQSRLRRLCFDFVYGRKIIKQINPDAVFYLQNTLIRGVSCQQIAYMDQLIPFQNAVNFSFWKKEQRAMAVYQHLIGRLIISACKKTDIIIVQTEWMRDTIAHKCNISMERIIKVAPDIQIEEITETESDTLFSFKSFFYPAGDMIYKNHQCIVDAVRILKSRLSDEFRILFTLQDKKQKWEDLSEISCCGVLNHKEVLEKMSTCTLIFPSYVESYGLPLAEARLMNTIILAADTPFAREVLAGYENAYFFETFVPEQLANLMEKVINGTIKKVESKVVFDSSNQSGWGKVIHIIEEQVEHG